MHLVSQRIWLETDVSCLYEAGVTRSDMAFSGVAGCLVCLQTYTCPFVALECPMHAMVAGGFTYS
jgi:hypothetical protein